jgi:hypothetical protein
MKMGKRETPWGNEKAMRPVIAARRAENIRMRSQGAKWREIAAALGYKSAQHARVDWERAQKPACKPRDNCLKKKGGTGRNSTAPHHSAGRDAP